MLYAGGELDDDTEVPTEASTDREVERPHRLRRQATAAPLCYAESEDSEAAVEDGSDFAASGEDSESELKYQRHLPRNALKHICGQCGQQCQNEQDLRDHCASNHPDHKFKYVRAM